MKRALSLIFCICLLMSCLTFSASASSYVTFTGDCNVRTGPGLSYAKLGSMAKGSTLTYLEESSVDERGVTWYKVSFNSSYGWVSSKYASLSGDSSVTIYVRATGRVNVRSGPGVSYDSFNTMEEGEQVLYLGNSAYDSNGTLWYQIQYYSYGTYWVSSVYSELVTTGSIGIASDTPTTTGTYVQATGGKSSIRTGPGLSYSIQKTLQKGEIATYLGLSSTDERGRVWYYINYNGTIGWVSSRYTTLY